MAETKLHCTIVTPERPVFEAEAARVTVPAHDGEVGILPGHARLIAKLGPGELRVASRDGTHSFYVEGGFCEVAEDRVTVLADMACAIADLDVQEAEARVNELRPRGLGGEFAEARRRWLARRRVKERSRRS